MHTELSISAKVVGVRQTRRAIEGGRALKAFLAVDADPRVTDPIARLCEEQNVSVERDVSMKELGKLCGVSVGTAVAATVRE